MSAKDQPKTDQKEYGDVQAAEETQAGLDATAAAEAANMPQVEIPEIQPQQGPPSVLQRPQNLMQRIPHRYDVGQPQKTMDDAMSDIGLLFEALAADPRVDPATVAAFRRLRMEE